MKPICIFCNNWKMLKKTNWSNVFKAEYENILQNRLLIFEEDKSNRNYYIIPLNYKNKYKLDRQWHLERTNLKYIGREIDIHKGNII